MKEEGEGGRRRREGEGGREEEGGRRREGGERMEERRYLRPEDID